MQQYRIITILCLSILLVATPIFGAVLQVFSGGDNKPADPDYEYKWIPIDPCIPKELFDLLIALEDTTFIVDDTSDGTRDISSYFCAPWSEPGPEHIYQLDVAMGDTLEFWVGLRDIDESIDHDLFLLDGCDTDACLIGVNTEMTAILTGGSYYLIVDGAVGPPPGKLDMGRYTIAYNCRHVGVDPQVFEPGEAIEVAVGQPVPPISGNLFFNEETNPVRNFVQNFDCSPILLKGREVWYSLTVPAPELSQTGDMNFSEFKMEFITLAPTLDVAIWLFDDCDSIRPCTNPVCLNHINDFVGGGGESLTFRNEGSEDKIIFLGIDCFRDPTENALGNFTIEFSSDGINPLACEAGTAMEVDIGQPESIFDGNLFGKENLVESFGCSPKVIKGGESWYTLTMPPAMDNQFGGKDFSEFSVEFTEVSPTLDIALWLFDGCDTYPICLDFANADNDTIPGEIMTYRNETDKEVKVYLGVDTVQEPGNSETGYFTIRFTSDIVVPTKKSSFGSVRALYR